MSASPTIRRILPAAALCLVIIVGYVAWVLSQDWDHRVQRWLAQNAWNGNIVRMRLCLALGASPNGTVAGTGPALTSAAAAGRIDSVRFLLAHGSDINIQNKWGMTPLMEASSYGHLEMARALLDAGADPNAISQGFEAGATALSVSAAQKHPDITDLLLSRGAKSHDKQ